MFFTSMDNILRSSELAGSSSTNLKMKFPNSFSIEHSVEGGNLIYVHFIDFYNFSNFSHSIQRQEVIALFLSKMKKWYDCRSFPIWWKLGQYIFNFFIIFGSELEGSRIIIIFSLSMRNIAWKVVRFHIG